MRTTLTLDPDVAAKLKAEARRTGKPFKTVVNEALRLGLASRREAPAARFEVRTRDLGGLRPGLSYDNVEELLDQIEGPLRR
ncbi:MAG TPA: BrnA antitoxin family protein [Thermodesulfobacteriota bacterium]